MVVPELCIRSPFNSTCCDEVVGGQPPALHLHLLGCSCWVHSAGRSCQSLGMVRVLSQPGHFCLEWDLSMGRSLHEGPHHSAGDVLWPALLPCVFLHSPPSFPFSFQRCQTGSIVVRKHSLRVSAHMPPCLRNSLTTLGTSSAAPLFPLPWALFMFSHVAYHQLMLSYLLDYNCLSLPGGRMPHGTVCLSVLFIAAFSAPKQCQALR